jgi:hypothetical protein
MRLRSLLEIGYDGYSHKGVGVMRQEQQGYSKYFEEICGSGIGLPVVSFCKNGCAGNNNQTSKKTALSMGITRYRNLRQLSLAVSFYLG